MAEVVLLPLCPIWLILLQWWSGGKLLFLALIRMLVYHIPPISTLLQMKHTSHEKDNFQWGTARVAEVVVFLFDLSTLQNQVYCPAKTMTGKVKEINTDYLASVRCSGGKLLLLAFIRCDFITYNLTSTLLQT